MTVASYELDYQKTCRDQSAMATVYPPAKNCHVGGHSHYTHAENRGKARILPRRKNTLKTRANAQLVDVYEQTMAYQELEDGERHDSRQLQKALAA